VCWIFTRLTYKKHNRNEFIAFVATSCSMGQNLLVFLAGFTSRSYPLNKYRVPHGCKAYFPKNTSLKVRFEMFVCDA